MVTRLTLSKAQRAELRMKFGGMCAYCGTALGEKGWHADHVEAVMRETKYAQNKAGEYRGVATGRLAYAEHDRIENLYPACGPCNIDKGPMDLEVWREFLTDRIDNGLRRNVSTFRHGERFGKITVTPGTIVFWFEKFTLASIQKA